VSTTWLSKEILLLQITFVSSPISSTETCSAYSAVLWVAVKCKETRMLTTVHVCMCVCMQSNFNSVLKIVTFPLNVNMRLRSGLLYSTTHNLYKTSS
jgi:hypothetical protein